jgi:hypothetical protein
MSGFDEREAKFEAEFAHDAALRFKVEARRNKLLGEWAAGLLGKTGGEIDDYAKSVVLADLEEAGDEDVFRKLRGDLGDDVSDDDIRAKMAEMLTVAKQQVQAGE